MKKAPQSAVRFFAGLCLFFSAVEFALPKPLPFLRYGVANLPILLALDFFSAAQIFELALLKCVLSAFMSGTLFSYVFVFSLASSLFSVAAMFLCKKIFGEKAISLLGVSLSGALASALAQIFVAARTLSIKTEFIAPPFLTCAFLTSIFLGAFAAFFSERSAWLSLAKSGKIDFDVSVSSQDGGGESGKPKKIAKAVVAAALFAALFFSKNLKAVSAAFAVSVALALFSRAKINFPMTFLTIFSIVLFNSLVPSGREIARIRSFSLTDGAILFGLRKAMAFEGAIFASKFFLGGSSLKIPAFAVPFAVFSRLCEQGKIEKGKFSVKKMTEEIDKKLTAICAKNI